MLARKASAATDVRTAAARDALPSPAPKNARAASVKISSFQWRAMKLRPREYGERKSVELSGPDRAPLTSVNLNTTNPVEASRVYQELIAGK